MTAQEKRYITTRMQMMKSEKMQKISNKYMPLRTKTRITERDIFNAIKSGKLKLRKAPLCPTTSTPYFNDFYDLHTLEKAPAVKKDKVKYDAALKKLNDEYNKVMDIIMLGAENKDIVKMFQEFAALEF